jgi:hypothetical protein
MQKQLTIAATQSQAAQAARAQLAGIDREREILRKQIASTQDSIDRDLAEGYRTRAVQSMAHMEHLKNELRTLDDKEEQARKEEGQAHAVVAATQEPAPVPSDAMAGVLGVMLEIVSLLSVVVASMQQQQPNARDDAKQNAAPFIQAQGETPTVHRVAESDISNECKNAWLHAEPSKGFSAQGQRIARTVVRVARLMHAHFCIVCVPCFLRC